MQARQIRRTNRHQHAQSQNGDCNSEQPAAKTKEYAFREQFAGNSAAPGPQRRADRHLELASFSPHQQQVGHVDARNQQHQPDGAHDNPQNTSNIANDLLLQ